MPNASEVDIEEVDNTSQVITPIGGIEALLGESKRGKYGASLVTSWQNFVRDFGGEYNGNPTITHAKMIFARGGQLVWNKLGHYTDIADPSTLDAVKASLIFANRAYYIRLNGPLIAGNSISLNVGSVVSTNFITNNDTTLASFLASLEVNSNVSVASLVNIVGSTGSDDRAIILIMATATVPSALTFTGTGAPTGTLDVANYILGSVNEKLFSFTPKNPGVDYNNVVIDIKAASNGNADYFDVVIRHLTDSTLPTETYPNLIIEGNPAIIDSKYLIKIQQQSKILDVVYYDLSTTTGDLRPINNTYVLQGGTNGSAVTEGDAIGDSAGKTGLHALDAFDEFTFIGCPQFLTTNMAVAGEAYVAARRECIYLVDIDPEASISAQDHIDFRDGTSIKSKYVAFVGGGVIAYDQVSQQEKNFSNTGPFLAAHAANDAKGKPWLSVAGPEQGQIVGTLAAIRDFGSAGSFNDLNQLANHQIMMIATSNKVRCILGNYSAQLDLSDFSFLSIVKLVIFLKKSLRPTLTRYLEKPNIPKTWKQLYYEVKPFLDNLASAEQEALISYDWQGDQFAKPDLSNLAINNASDIDLGKYKVRLKIKTVKPIIEIDVTIEMTPTSVSFTDNL